LELEILEYQIRNYFEEDRWILVGYLLSFILERKIEIVDLANPGKKSNFFLTWN